MTSERHEGELDHLAKQLGERAAARVDPEKTAWAVLARLRRAPEQRRWWQRVGLVPVAAAATVFLASALAINVWIGSGGSGIAPPLPVEIEELAANELTEILDSLSLELPIAEVVPATLSDLNEVQLERLLESMEG
jgi:hypothetical protein